MPSPTALPDDLSRPASADLGAVVLCGGASRRMGGDKAWLPFGGEMLLQRVVRILAARIAPPRFVLVAGVDQQLPELPDGPIIVRDESPDQGPLPALARGLAAVAEEGRIGSVLAVACDAPRLRWPALDLLVDRLQRSDPGILAIVPRINDRLHPLLAAYKPAAAAALAVAIRAGERSLHRALARVSLEFIDEQSLRTVDPELVSLANCNTPVEYAAALQAEGYSVREVS